jgi:hypothetical protein
VHVLRVFCAEGTGQAKVEQRNTIEPAVRDASQDH